jgi:hypothetical protein
MRHDRLLCVDPNEHCITVPADLVRGKAGNVIARSASMNAAPNGEPIGRSDAHHVLLVDGHPAQRRERAGPPDWPL